MSTIGPSLPSHLQTKRKRSYQNEDVSQHDHPSRTPSPQKRARNSSSSSSPEPQPRRIIGPSAPPAPLSELPPPNPTPDAAADDFSDDDDDDDDDFGPSLPPPPGSSSHATESARQQKLAADELAKKENAPPKREDWMLVPPKQDDWSARLDPTKLRNRKFNTGKGSKAPPSSSNSKTSDALWTETPDQKRQRLEDEVMGIKKPAQLGPEVKRDKWKEQEAEETRRRIEKYNERNRHDSLMNEHKKVVPKEKEDDPSARVFDKEKDIGLGVKVGHAQRREMLNRAKDFGERFAGGSYL